MSDLDKFLDLAASDDNLRVQFRRTSDPHEFARLAVEIGQNRGFSFTENEVLQHIAHDEKVSRAHMQGVGVKEIPKIRLALRQWELRADVNPVNFKKTP